MSGTGLDSLSLLQPLRAALLHVRDVGRRLAGGRLDGRYVMHLSCGHTWTMRHTACPVCFAELCSRVAELEEALKDLVLANEEWNRATERIVGRPPGWSDAYLDRARRLLGMEVEP